MPEFTHKGTGRVIRTREGTRVHELVTSNKDYEAVKKAAPKSSSKSPAKSDDDK